METDAMDSKNPAKVALVPRRGLAGGALRTASLLPLVLLMAACAQKPPQGQVVARVNGADITVQQLDSEARSIGPSGAKTPKQILLQRVMARVLLAQAAHDQKLDQYPGYPADKLRLEQTSLAQLTLAKNINQSPSVSPSDVSKFMADHPFVFAGRQRFKLDQIHVPSGGTIVDALKKFENENDLITYLTRTGVPYTRGEVVVDTANLPPTAAQQLMALPPGTLLYTQAGQEVIFSLVADHQPMIAPPAEQAAAATQLLRQQMVTQQVEAQVKKLKDSATITYQPGFEPPKPKKAK
jgi:EpsD family peptidyl-prolyl cis-trans isomerase